MGIFCSKTHKNSILQRVLSPYNGLQGPALSDLSRLVFPPHSRLRGLCAVPQTARLIPHSPMYSKYLKSAW